MNTCDNSVLDIDVLIVGAGPAGLALSFLLEHEPLYHGEHPLLPFHERFQQQRTSDSPPPSLYVPLDELKRLSDGLTGRSQNPVSLFWDQLAYPLVDTSSHRHPHYHHIAFKPVDNNQRIKFLVMDKGAKGGGSWNQFENEFAILSPAYWMELPGHRYTAADNDWDRVPRSQVASYFNLVADTIVDGADADDASRIIFNTRITNVSMHTPATSNQRWLVQTDNPAFPLVSCSRLVLASGMYDVPRTLGIPGERLPFVYHRMQTASTTSNPRPAKKALVVGAGLSAADAINYLMENHISVVHIFRSDLSDPDQAIAKFQNSRSYEEYANLFDLMTGAKQSPLYEPLHHYALTAVAEDGQVVLQHSSSGGSKDDTGIRRATVDLVFILIGSRPDLSFFPALAHLDIHPKTSPLPVDPFTFRLDPNSISQQPTDDDSLTPPVYAIGPLAGDNFVRFITGHAYGVARDIHVSFKK